MRPILLVVAGCAAEDWTNETCVGGDADSPVVLEVGEGTCVELGPTGGIAGFQPDGQLDGTCLVLRDETVVNQDDPDAVDAMGMAYQLYEAAEVGSCTVTVTEGTEETEQFVVSFTVEG